MGVKEQVKLSIVHYWCPVFQSLVLINVICPAIREPFTLLAVIRLVYGLTQGYPIVQCCIRSTEQTKEDRGRGKETITRQGPTKNRMRKGVCFVVSVRTCMCAIHTMRNAARYYCKQLPCVIPLIAPFLSRPEEKRVGLSFPTEYCSTSVSLLSTCTLNRIKRIRWGQLLYNSAQVTSAEDSVNVLCCHPH